jgi:AcrR family transcriptional regulator
VSPRDDLAARAVAWFAANGVGDTSLRTLAAGIGTSHRMLNYHFGSREGLLAAVVEQVERSEREALERFRAATTDPWEAGRAFWEHVVSTADVFAPLYFELSSQAMRNREFAAPLRRWLAEGWLEPLTDTFAAAVGPGARAEELARLALAVARGLLFDLAVTGDRATVDATMEQFTDLIRRGTDVGAHHDGSPPDGG